MSIGQNNANLNTSENTSAAESQIRDTDMAKEMADYFSRISEISCGSDTVYVGPAFLMLSESPYP